MAIDTSAVGKGGACGTGGGALGSGEGVWGGPGGRVFQGEVGSPEGGVGGQEARYGKNAVRVRLLTPLLSVIVCEVLCIDVLMLILVVGGSRSRRRSNRSNRLSRT